MPTLAKARRRRRERLARLECMGNPPNCRFGGKRGKTAQGFRRRGTTRKMRQR